MSKIVIYMIYLKIIFCQKLIFFINNICSTPQSCHSSFATEGSTVKYGVGSNFGKARLCSVSQKKLIIPYNVHQLTK